MNSERKLLTKVDMYRIKFKSAIHRGDKKNKNKKNEMIRQK